MYCRLFLSIYLATQLAPVFAESAAWSCGKVGRGGEWDCVGKSQPAVRLAKIPKATTLSTTVFNDKPLTASQPIANRVQSSPALMPVLAPKPMFVTASSQTLPKVPVQASRSSLAEPPTIVVAQSSALPVKPTEFHAPLISASPPQVNEKPEPKPASSTCAKEVEAAPKVAAVPAQSCAKPQNQSKAVSIDHGLDWIEQPYNQAEERIFAELYGGLKADPWGACMTSGPDKEINPYRLLNFNTDIREETPVNIDSDYSEIFDKVTSSFSGNVQMDRADQHMTSDKANYNTASQVMDAQGHVYYKEDQILMYSDSMQLNLPTDEARIRKALFLAPGSAIRGSARVVYKENDILSHYKDAVITGCPPGHQDWAIHAERFKMNKYSGQAVASNFWMEFKGVPFLYLPFLSFQTDQRRKSGFINTSFSPSGNNGMYITQPYYWNMAPNYDALLSPRYLAKRGFILGGIFRHINEMSQNSLKLEVLPEDKADNNRTRFQGSLKSLAQYSPYLSTNIDLNYVSDQYYMSQTGNALNFVYSRFMRSAIDLNYNRQDITDATGTTGISFLTRLENFQAIDPTILPYQIPYRKLPQVVLNLNHNFANLLTVGLENDFAYFQHSYNIAELQNVEGARVNIKPYVSAPWRNDSGFAIPKLSLAHTDYFLQNQFAGNPSGISRNLPVASFDAGLFIEGDLDLFGKHFQHTLEPRLFYLYVPKSNQNAMPIFDTAVYDTNIDSLFRENRFSGSDRWQNANQLSFALTSRFLDADSGRERFKISVGSTAYFQDRQAEYFTAPTSSPSISSIIPLSLAQSNSFSNIITELSGRVTDELSIGASFQWDIYTRTMPRQQLSLNYLNKQTGVIFNMAYIHRKDLNPAPCGASPSCNPTLLPVTNYGYSYLQETLSQQGDVSFRVPLIDNWSLVGRYIYSFLYGKPVDEAIGLTKENCCFRFRFLVRDYIYVPTLVPGALTPVGGPLAIGTSTGLSPMFEIEFKGIASSDDGVSEFLKKYIPGYNQL